MSDGNVDGVSDGKSQIMDEGAAWKRKMNEDVACWLIILGSAFVTCLLTFRFTESPNRRFKSWWQHFSYWWDSLGLPLFALLIAAYMFIAGALGFLKFPAVEY
jgi:hypothetical protein